MDMEPSTAIIENETARKLLDKIDSRSARIAVVGVGYVGLPLAIHFVEDGFNVEGYDVNAETVSNLNSGVTHIKDVPSERVKNAVKEKRQKRTGRLKF